MSTEVTVSDAGARSCGQPGLRGLRRLIALRARRTPALSSTLVLLACLAFPRQSWAIAHGQVTTLDYVAPMECPARDVFWQRLTNHAYTATKDSAGTTAVSLEVLIATSVEGYSARLTVATPEQLVTRQLTDAQCGALVDALALIAAIAMDPAHRNVVASDRPTSGLSRPMPIALRVAPASLWTLGVGFGLNGSAAPVILHTFSAYVNHRRNDFGMVGHYFVAVTYGRTEWLSFGLGQARFSRYAARLAACPLGSSVDRFSFGACMLTDIGWLQGNGDSASGPMSTGGAWLTPGVGVNTSLVLTPFELGWYGGVVTPLVRDRYFFAPAEEVKPGETVFKASGIGLVAELRIGWVIR